MFLWNSVNFCSPHVRIQDSWKVKTGVCRVLHGARFSTWSTELFCSCVPNMKRCLAPPWKKDRSWSNAQCLPFVWLRKTSPNSLLSCWKKMSHFCFQQDPALRRVKHNKADICIPELALALPKLQLTNYLCGVVWKWKVVSAVPHFVIRSCLCQP